MFDSDRLPPEIWDRIRLSSVPRATWTRRDLQGVELAGRSEGDGFDRCPGSRNIFEALQKSQRNCRSFTVEVPREERHYQATRKVLHSLCGRSFEHSGSGLGRSRNLTIEECNFFHNCTGPPADLTHLRHFRVKRVSMPIVACTSVALAANQPPVVVVDKLRTHLWRNDHFNVFSSKEFGS
ncbi:hypothetical protein quinque_016417 [Culex quinquefasciatus]